MTCSARAVLLIVMFWVYFIKCEAWEGFVIIFPGLPGAGSCSCHQGKNNGTRWMKVVPSRIFLMLYLQSYDWYLPIGSCTKLL